MNTCIISTHTHNLWFWLKRPPLAFSVAETPLAEMSGRKRPRLKCPWPKCPTFKLLNLCSAQIIKKNYIIGFKKYKYKISHFYPYASTVNTSDGLAHLAVSYFQTTASLLTFVCGEHFCHQTSFHSPKMYFSIKHTL